jgi:hypothetical protein
VCSGWSTLVPFGVVVAYCVWRGSRNVRTDGIFVGNVLFVGALVATVIYWVKVCSPAN